MVVAEPPAEQAVSPQERWPAVPFAYEFVRPSYEFLAHRREVIENRVRAIMTLAGTLLFAAPVVYRTADPSADLHSPWLLGALAVFVLLIASGLTAQVGRSISALSPRAMYNTMLHLEEWEFKKNVLYRASEDFGQNAEQINRKGQLANAVVTLLSGEILFLIAWVLNIPVWT